jgi:hypothetical protein
VRCSHQGAPVGPSVATIFGSTPQRPQVTALHNRVDIVVACPGRLADLIGQGHCHLGDVEVSVVDEADHMAGLGFLPACAGCWTRPRHKASRCCFPRPSTTPSMSWSAGSSITRPSTPPTRPGPPAPIVHHLVTVAPAVCPGGQPAAHIEDPDGNADNLTQPIRHDRSRSAVPARSC